MAKIVVRAPIWAIYAGPHDEAIEATILDCVKLYGASAMERALWSERNRKLRGAVRKPVFEAFQVWIVSSRSVSWRSVQLGSVLATAFDPSKRIHQIADWDRWRPQMRLHHSAESYGGRVSSWFRSAVSLLDSIQGLILVLVFGSIMELPWEMS